MMIRSYGLNPSMKAFLVNTLTAAHHTLTPLHYRYWPKWRTAWITWKCESRLMTLLIYNFFDLYDFSFGFNCFQLLLLNCLAICLELACRVSFTSFNILMLCPLKNPLNTSCSLMFVWNNRINYASVFPHITYNNLQWSLTTCAVNIHPSPTAYPGLGCPSREAQTLPPLLLFPLKL